MKKTLILIIPFLMMLVFAFCSCSKEEPELPQTNTQYTVNFLTTPPKGFTINLTLFEYNSSGEKIGQNHLKNCTYGVSEQFTASPKSEKVKVYMVSEFNGQSFPAWVQQVYYLNKGNNTDININGEIRVGSTEP